MGAKKTAYINNRMLKWAREQTPYKHSLELVAEKAAEKKKKISAENLESWESGRDLPSLTNAKYLATIYKVPFACFYLSEPPQNQIKSYANRRTIAGHPDREISIELWGEIQDMLSNRDNAIECYPDLESIFPVLPKCNKKDAIKEIANNIRDFIGHNPPFKNKSAYNDDPFKFFRQLFENRGILVFQMNNVKKEEVRGISIYNDALSIIGVTNGDEKRAKVFTLFHEMAHLVSRNNESFCLVDFNDDNGDEEKWCDQVAAETLLPEDIFKENVAEYSRKFDNDLLDDSFLREIADKYGISQFVVLRRLIDLNLIERDKYWERYDSMLKSYIDYSRKKSDKPLPIKYYNRYLNQNGKLYPRIILAAYDKGTISYGEMCQALSIKSQHINDIVRAVHK